MTKAEMLEMDDQRREKFKTVSCLIVDVLKANTESPIEAYAILQFIKDGFEETYGIKACLIYGKDKVAHS